MIQVNCNSCLFIDRGKEIERQEIFLLLFTSLSPNNLNVTVIVNIENKSHCYDELLLSIKRSNYYISLCIYEKKKKLNNKKNSKILVRKRKFLTCSRNAQTKPNLIPWWMDAKVFFEIRVSRRSGSGKRRENGTVHRNFHIGCAKLS